MVSVRCGILFDEQTFNKNEGVNECMDCERITHGVRLSLLRLLTYLGQNVANSFEKLQWGYTFFNSEGPEFQIMEKQAFSPFDLLSYELFEENLIGKANRLCATLGKKCPETSDTDFKKHKNVLKQALSQFYTDFNWDVPDISSPVSLIRRKKHSFGSKSYTENPNSLVETVQNYIFIISPIENFGKPTEISNCKKNIFHLLLPKSLYNMLTKDSHIELFWLDDRNSATYQSDFDVSKLRDRSKFGVVPMKVLASDLIEYQNMTFDFRKESLVPVSTLLSQYLQKENTKNKCKKSFEHHVPLKSKEDNILCHLNISPIWSDENFSVTELSEWKSLQIESCLKLTPQLFPFLTGCTFSATPVNSKDMVPFSALMIECISKNFIFVASCSQKDSDQTVLIRPVTITTACLILPANPQFPKILYEKILGEQNNPDTLDAFKPSNEETNVQPFNCIALEKWPACSEIIESSSTSLKIKELSNQNECNIVSKIKEFMKSANLTKSNTPRRAKIQKSEKSLAANDSKPHTTSSGLRRSHSNTSNFSVSHRSSLLLERSLSMKNISKSSEQQNEKPNKKKFLKTKTEPIISLNITLNEDSNEESVVSHLKDLYGQTASGSGSILTCTQNIIGILSYFVINSKQTNLKDLIEKHFFLNAKTVAENLQTPSKKLRLVREYQLQVLLRLELEMVLQRENLTCDCCKTIITILRSLSFVEGVVKLNRFLQDVIKENYGETLRELVEEIGDELNIPLFDDSQSSAESDYEMEKLMSNISYPSCSSIGSASNPSVSGPKNNKRALTRHPSMLQSQLQRQIEVPTRSLPKSKKKETPKAKRFKRRLRASARIRASSQKKKQTNKESISEVKNVCRNLFKIGKSPSQKDTPKSVTPKRYQKKRSRDDNPNETGSTPRRSKRVHIEKTPNKRVQTPKSKARTPKRKSLIHSFSPEKKIHVLVKESPKSFLFQDLMPSPVASKILNFDSPKQNRVTLQRKISIVKASNSAVKSSSNAYGLDSPLLSIYMKNKTPVKPSKCIRNLSENLNFCGSPISRLNEETFSSPAKNTRARTHEQNKFNSFLESEILPHSTESNKVNECGNIFNTNESPKVPNEYDSPSRNTRSKINYTPKKLEDSHNSLEEKNSPKTDHQLLFKSPPRNGLNSFALESPSKKYSPKSSSIAKNDLYLTPRKVGSALISPRNNRCPKTMMSPKLKLYSQLYISPEEIKNKVFSLQSESPRKTSPSIKEPGDLPKSPMTNHPVKPDDLSLRWPVRKKGRLSHSLKKNKLEWAVVNSPQNNQNLTISLKRIPSFNKSSDSEKEGEQVQKLPGNCDVNVLQPSFKSPSALSLLHLTTSPVLNL